MACGCASEKDEADGDGAAGTRGLDGIVTLPDGGDGDGDGDGDGAVDEGDPDGSIGDGSVANPDGGDGDAGDSSTPGCDATDEICDELDNDCDLKIDEDLAVGEACDGPDDDDCRQGRLECADDGEVVCEEAARDLSAEVCDQIDNDCDDEIDEGFADLGDTCDSSDDDLCEDGEIVCNSAGDGTRCSDDATELLDLCDGVDNDCDSASADGSEDSRLGDACDGTDSDLCTEGTYSCPPGGIACSDATGSTLDVCNAVDDDCDPASANGSEDPQINMPCDGADTDLCTEGVFSCPGTSLSCSDATGSTVESCNGNDDDCDDYSDEDFERNTNPICAGSPTFLGTVGADLGSDLVSENGYEERWLQVTVSEEDSDSVYLSATVELESPLGTDFDLNVYCDSCGGELAGYSDSTVSPDQVLVRKADTVDDDSFDLLIQVVYFSSTACVDWTLSVTGNTIVDVVTCD